MKRRTFLISGLAMAALTRSASLFAQTPGPRAAIVIGVNRSAGLTHLQGSVPGAQKVSNWLKSEGFEVSTLTDDKSPLKLDDVYQEAKRLINLGTLNQLIIFFSGHGINFFTDEYWLLSGAPENPNEVISVKNAIQYARWTAIPNVVFISDACRTPPEDISLRQLRPGSLFPTLKPTSIDVEVDRFFATLPGDPALELSFSKNTKRHGVFTEAFLDAYKFPDAEMVSVINGIQVIPNRSLKRYLTREVPKRVLQVTVKKTQLPQSIIESGDETYIGRYYQKLGTTPKAPKPPNVTLTDVANFALKGAGLSSLKTDTKEVFTTSKLEEASISIGFQSAKDTILNASRDTEGRRRFETQTGLNIYGAELKSVTTNPLKLDAGIFTKSNAPGRPWIVRLHPVEGSVLLRFQDDSGAIVACLPGYIGTVVVKESGVASVSYEPSKGGDLDVPNPSIKAKLQELRSAVAVAARFGTLNFQGPNSARKQSAKEFGDKIRELKRIDPTLGIYAAYAYSDAGLIDYVQSVHTYMRRDLSVHLSVNGSIRRKKTDIFDVSMLSGNLPATLNNPSINTVPFCPMLSQGWNLMTVHDVKIDPFLDHARSFLRPALWSTFRPEIMDDLENYMSI